MNARGKGEVENVKAGLVPKWEFRVLKSVVTHCSLTLKVHVS